MNGKRAWAILGAVAAICALANSTAAQDSGRTAVTDIRQEASATSTRLVVECTGPLAYTYYSPDPLTLVIDIPEVDASQMPARIDVGTREVESLRITGMARGDGRSLTRIEVRLASVTPFQIYSKDKSLHMVFEREGVAGAAEDLESGVDPAPEPADPPLVLGAATLEPRLAPQEPVFQPELPTHPATRILGVSHSSEGGQLALTIRSDGRLDYQDFFLGNPDRLVVDLPGVLNEAPRAQIQVNEGPLQRIRVAQFSMDDPRVTRVVLDLLERSPYRAVETAEGLQILFGEGTTPSPGPLAALRSTLEPRATTTAAIQPALGSFASALPPAAAPVPILQEPLISEGIDPEFEEGLAPPKYTGDPITLDFKDGDLVDIFRLFADISGLNVVINPGVGGKVSLKLTAVPWDQALDLILKTNGLGRTQENNVIRIARVADLQREKEELRRLQEAKELEGELLDYTKRISYAKANELQGVLQDAGALSPRGQINVDARTNTILIRDLETYIEMAKELIVELDVPTPQVEIEARIVVTSRNFTRDIGVQWGFHHEQSPRYGNQTTRGFPSTIVLAADGSPSAGGIPAGVIDGGLAGVSDYASRGYAVNLPASGHTTGFGVTLGNILGNFNLDAALTALERQGRGRLLSTPKITTQNNQEATIKQGVQIPIQTVANNTITVTFKDAVLTLKVTPQITDAGTVILKVSVENNSADFANLVLGIPPINTQSAETNVLVKDGSTAVIGGIYSSNEQSSENTTPLLGKIPLLGYLFRNRFSTTNNNELLLFITPRIIKGV